MGAARAHIAYAMALLLLVCRAHVEFPDPPYFPSEFLVWSDEQWQAANFELSFRALRTAERQSSWVCADYSALCASQSASTSLRREACARHRRNQHRMLFGGPWSPSMDARACDTAREYEIWFQRTRHPDVLRALTSFEAS